MTVSIIAVHRRHRPVTPCLHEVEEQISVDDVGVRPGQAPGCDVPLGDLVLVRGEEFP
jgi:hypothetical protein